MKQAHSIFLVAALLAVAGCSTGSRSSKVASTAAPATTGGQTGPGGTGTTTTPPTGSGGSGGVTGEFQRTYQGRSYWLYVPDGYTATQATPLAVCFHGAGDSGTNFYNTMKGTGWTTAARAQNVIFVVPDSKSPLSDFANWSGNPNQDFAAMKTELDDVLALVTADVGASYNVDTGSIHALGFSNGGLFLAVAGLPHTSLATNSIFGYGWGGAYPVTPTDKRPVHMACGTQDNSR